MPFPKDCRGCGLAFIAHRRTTAFHSRSCFATWRESTPVWQAAKRRGQLKSAETGRRKSLVVWERKVGEARSKGEAFRFGHRDGYRLGWKRGERVGFAKGYDAAIESMEGKSA